MLLVFVVCCLLCLLVMLSLHRFSFRTTLYPVTVGSRVGLRVLGFLFTAEFEKNDPKKTPWPPCRGLSVQLIWLQRTEKAESPHPSRHGETASPVASLPPGQRDSAVQLVVGALLELGTCCLCLRLWVAVLQLSWNGTLSEPAYRHLAASPSLVANCGSSNDLLSARHQKCATNGPRCRHKQFTPKHVHGHPSRITRKNSASHTFSGWVPILPVIGRRKD